MNQDEQNEAIRLAQHLEQFRGFPDDLKAAKELRRLHAENEWLRKVLSALIAAQANQEGV